jgi:predicted HAD superfamily Cof-like phosphohydrolase
MGRIISCTSFHNLICLFWFQIKKGNIMFTETLPAAVFTLQRDFIAAMGASRDFVWWADTLITEETKELREAYEKPEFSDENMKHIFKELGDVIYVVAGCYNTMPVYAPEIVDGETNQRIQNIMDDAASLVSRVSQKLEIPLSLIILSFELVHHSNMSKLDDNGKPIRRDDGKILKGPNYREPDMGIVLTAYKEFQRKKMETANATAH